jgi:hypothetical protein
MPQKNENQEFKELMKKIFLLFTILSISNLYSQEEFKLIGKTQTGGNYYVKIDKSSPNECSIWLKIEFTKILKNKKGKKYSVKDGYQLNYMIIHCTEKLSDNLEYVIYDKNNIVIESGNKLDYGKRIFPESITESIFNYVCTEINID